MDNNDLQAIENLLYRVSSEIANKAKDIAPYQTGNLKRDIQVFDEHIDRGEVIIGNSLLAEYGVFVHEGTGLYGKYKRKIHPKKGKALKTPWGYRKSIKGQKAQPYLSDAVREYINSGAFDRAIDETGDALSEDIFDGLKASLRTIITK